jgi:SAM-dependent methyltransferase
MTQEPYTGRATTFDTAAELYEQARPGYPPALFVDLSAALGTRAAHARVLEIGAGTGQATRGLLDQGWSVVALEPGARLAAVARRVLAGRGDVEVVEQPFERWDPRDREPFDLVLAATSWHWVDPRVGYRRAAEVLRPGGHLAVVATEHVLPPDGDDFFRQVEAAYDEVGLGDGRGGPAHPDTIEPPDVAALRASGCFEEPAVRRYLWALDYTADEYVALLSTYSNHIAATPEQRATLFAAVRHLIGGRPSGTVRKHYLTLVQDAPRAP